MSRTKEKHPSHEGAGNARHKDESVPAGSVDPGTCPADGAAPMPAAETDANKTVVLEDRLLRLRADFDNFRKRALREKNEVYDMAASELMLDLLPVLDHIQLGVQAASDHKSIQDGLRLIFDQLMGVLSKYGLAPFDVEKQPFDPARCEAISVAASDHVPEGIVMVQTRRGYLLRNRLLRPAQVVVSSGPACTSAETDKNDPSSRDLSAATED